MNYGFNDQTRLMNVSEYYLYCIAYKHNKNKRRKIYPKTLQYDTGQEIYLNSIHNKLPFYFLVVRYRVIIEKCHVVIGEICYYCKCYIVTGAMSSHK